MIPGAKRQGGERTVVKRQDADLVDAVERRTWWPPRQLVPFVFVQAIDEPEVAEMKYRIIGRIKWPRQTIRFDGLHVIVGSG